MKKTLDDVLTDIEQNLIGKTLKGISGSAAAFKITTVDRENKYVVLDVNGNRKTWSFERMGKVWNEMYYRPAANVEVVFGGSGSSRNQVETIFASLAYVEWLYIQGKKSIAYIGEPTHEYGVLKQMDDEATIRYESLMAANNPRNPLLDDDEFPDDGNKENHVSNEEHFDTVEKLGKELRTMYDSAEAGMQVCSIHVFGIKYGGEIISHGFKPIEIVKAAGLQDSYYTELNKALNIYKALAGNTYGITLSILKGRRDNSNRITGGKNILFYGVPGAGKSYAIKEIIKDSKWIERAVFHPDYSYSDFVGQILPAVEKTESGEDRLRYRFIPGPFTRMIKKAEEHPGNMCYLVIEEINRGNAPAIFGEVFQLLDRDSSGTSEYGISNAEIANEVYGDKEQPVVIPSNLTLLATMNTSDQNVFTLDTAFQRRWEMKQIPNNVNGAQHAENHIDGSSVTWGAFASVVNEAVIDANSDMVSSEDKRLGAYFVRQDELTVDRFPEKALKYLWDDAFKMNRDYIFNPEMKTLEQVIEVYSHAEEDRLKAVLRMEVYQKMISSLASKEAEGKADGQVDSQPEDPTEKSAE